MNSSTENSTFLKCNLHVSKHTVCLQNTTGEINIHRWHYKQVQTETMVVQIGNYPRPVYSLAVSFM